MKAMTCKQLGGSCDQVFQAETFEEIAELSRQHGKQMFEKRDPAHIEAMQAMKEQMQDPQAMTQWFESRRREFEALPDLS